MKKNITTPTIPPAVVERRVCIKLSPIPNDKAGASRNLIVLTANTINIFINPDKSKSICLYNAAFVIMLQLIH